MSEPIKCAVCEKNPAELQDLFILVNSHSSSHSTPIGFNERQVTYTSSESVAGSQQLGVCRACVRKHRIRDIGPCVIFFVVIFLFIGLSTDFSGVFWVFFVLLMLFNLFFIVPEVAISWPFVLEKLLQKKNPEMQYVPTNPKHYCLPGKTTPNKTLFQLKNRFKVIKMSDTLFAALYDHQGH